ncbi:glycosyltransferase family 4 protein [Planococcus sp. SIMBA_143]
MSVIYISSFYPTKREPYRGHFVKKQAEILARTMNEQLIIIKPRVLKRTGNKNDGKWILEERDPQVYVFEFINSFGLMSINANTHKAYYDNKAEIFKNLEMNKPKLIISNDYWSSIILGNQLSKEFECQHFNIVHGEESTVTGNSWIHHKKIKAELKQCDQVFAVSNRIKTYLEKRFAYKSSIVLHNGLPKYVIDTYNAKKIIKTDQLVITSVGNLSYNKGFDKVLAALKSFEEPFTYNIIGEGPYRKKILSFIEKYSLKGKVNLIGSLDNEEVYFYLEHSDFFILPSRREAFGIVYLESMITKNVCIGSRHQGCEDFIEHGVNGYLVESEEEILTILKNLQLNSRKKNEVIEKAYETAIHFTWEKNVEKLKKYIR